MNLRIVFPCWPFEPRKIDLEFESEQAAVRLLGGRSVMFDFDLFKKGEVDEALRNVPVLATQQMWTYRGWMMAPELYEQFYNEMKKRGYLLTNSPAVYSICHVYPLVYPYVKDRAVSTFSTEGDQVDHDALVQFFGNKPKKIFVKDWVKSAKGTPGATVINDHTNLEEVLAVTSKLKEERGDLFYYGFVFKEFINILKRPRDGKDEEYRAFFVKDKLVTWSPAHGPGGQDLKAPDWVHEASSKVPGDFYTLDFVFVEGADGKPEAVILEAGDGGVSGLSVGQMPITLYSALEEHELVNK